jgi:hypothetical protein
MVPVGSLLYQCGKRRADYHPIELFGMSVLPDEIVEGFKERQSKAIKTRTWEAVGKAEAEYSAYGIQSGATNTALNELIPIYRSAGFTPEEAAAEFTALLADDYAGELRTSPRRLLQRVKAYYKNVPETRFNTLPKQTTDELFTEVIAQAIAALVTGATETAQQRGALTKRRRTIKKAVILIERWRLYLISVINSKRFLEMWNYLYPYFKKNTAEGYFPISRNIFKQKIHEHYEKDVLPFLRKLGYLERAPYKYSSVYGICYYYKINGFQFIKAMPSAPSEPHCVSKAQSRAEQIRAYKQEHPEVSIRVIADALGYGRDMVHRALRDL